MDFSQHLLSILIWLPIVGGALLIAIGDDNDADSSRAGIMRIVANQLHAQPDDLNSYPATLVHNGHLGRHYSTS